MSAATGKALARTPEEVENGAVPNAFKAPLDTPKPEIRPKSSAKRVAASRSNGRLSQGPTTPQGKLRSAKANPSALGKSDPVTLP